MMGWIARLWRGRAENRYVFHYHDGRRKRSADPLVIERHLIAALGEDWRKVVREIEAPLPLGMVGSHADAERRARLDQMQGLYNAIDEAFGVHAYTDYGGAKRADGLTEVARLGLLKAYIRFCGALVELARPFVIAQSRASPPPDNPPTASASDSTSTELPSPVGVPVI